MASRRKQSATEKPLGNVVAAKAVMKRRMMVARIMIRLEAHRPKLHQRMVLIDVVSTAKASTHLLQGLQALPEIVRIQRKVQVLLLAVPKIVILCPPCTW